MQLVLRPPCHVFPQQTRPHNIACGRKHFFARETGGQSRQRTLQEFFEDHCRPVTRSFSILFTCCCKLLRGSLCYIGQKVFFSSDIVIVINNRRKNEWNSYTRSIVTQRVEHFWCSKKMINHFMWRVERDKKRCEVMEHFVVNQTRKTRCLFFLNIPFFLLSSHSSFLIIEILEYWYS